MKVNDWYTFNKKTLINSRLAIDTSMALPNGEEADITIEEEEERRRIVHFNETDHLCSAVNEKGESR